MILSLFYCLFVLKVDLKGYEKAKEEALLKSQGTLGSGVCEVDLDVHDIASLQECGVPLTNDQLKYCYSFRKKKRKYGESLFHLIIQLGIIVHVI